MRLSLLLSPPPMHQLPKPPYDLAFRISRSRLAAAQFSLCCFFYSTRDLASRLFALVFPRKFVFHRDKTGDQHV